MTWKNSARFRVNWKAERLREMGITGEKEG